MYKFIAGSANFNQSYGISKFKFKKKKLKESIEFLKKNKINYIDTAFEYNLSNKYLSDFNFSKFKIITKIKIPSKNFFFYIKNIEKKILKKLYYFKIKKFEAVLFHDVNDLKGINGKKILKILQKLKKKGKIKKIGVSIYNPNDLKLVYSKFLPDIIQSPLSIFDQRLIKSKYFKIIKKKKTLIQIRSIFLQGALLKKISYLKKINLNINLINNIKKLDSWCSEKGISRLEASIDFIKNLKGIDFITIGFNSKKELNEILQAFKKNKNLNYKKFALKNNKLLDIRKWD